ncbi:unnamed protein product [Ilex paraguariensis]|uniref:Response regulatory domain-containing protein n=1 Tax=Ilex paraguariensis TaxID=185542 RepID=A0ABC8QXZ5_9AQUA
MVRVICERAAKRHSYRSVQLLELELWKGDVTYIVLLCSPHLVLLVLFVPESEPFASVFTAILLMESTGFNSPRTDTFPAGLRVLVVDDDPTWLKILEKMLKKCSYEEEKTVKHFVESLETQYFHKYSIVVISLSNPSCSTFLCKPKSSHQRYPLGMKIVDAGKTEHHCIIDVKMTTCGLAREALDLLRGRKDGFDIVISDVNMPDMDGFKLLENVGLEMDLPVISQFSLKAI